jgi:hypothetical protein
VTQPSRSTPKSWLAIALLCLASAFLGACGGGGATATNINGNGVDLDMIPGDTTNLYAGVPATFTIVGGRPPYVVSSSDVTILPINATISGQTFTIVPSNPGVVDVGLDPTEVPRRTVSIFVHDSGSGIGGTEPAKTIVRVYNVLQNFLTGYGVGYNSTCAAAGTTTAGQACSGQESVATFSPITSGILSGDRAMRVERLTGDYDFVVEGTGQLQSTLNFTTNHNGVGIARIRVRVGAVTQIATYRLIDVATTLSTIQQFVITGTPPPGTLTLIPSTLSFTGSSTTRCGTGSADVLIYDGKPPFLVQNTSPNLSVSPTVVTTLGSGFTVTAFNSSICLTGATVVVTDAEGRRATVTVTTAAGTAAPPVLSVSPSTVTLTCAANVATVAVVGGTGSNSAVSSSPRVTASVSGSSMQITRLLGDGATGPFPTTVTVSVTDGATIATVTVTSPASCP